MRIRTRLAQAVGTVVVATLALSACGTGTSGDNGRPSIVASTDVYGAIAKAVAGDDANVTSLFANPTGDPHEFEPSAQDTLKVKKASVLVFNGGHYDAYMEKAAEGATAAKVDAVSLQEPKGENEHVFYDLPTMAKVATAIASALGDRDTARRADYDDRAKKFGARLDGVIAQARAIGRANPAAKVVATEPVAGYLLSLSGLIDAAPARYTAAIESGTDPAPADIAAANTLVTEKRVRAVVLNSQTENPVTTNLAKTAEAASIPVVKVTESMPAGVDDYVTWQSETVERLATAFKRQP
ncbi:zinc ABC transporter substrate-binding protein [Tsukamurella serpentis]